jgi:hypothetical protein
MPVPEDELLKRFDVVFRTILVVAGIAISATIAFYKEILPPFAFVYSIGFFLAAISIWAISTLKGGTIEYSVKILAWWTLMTAFTLLVARLIFSNFLLPPFVTTLALATSLIFTWPLFSYFRGVISDDLEHTIKKIFKVALLAVFVADIISLIIVLIPRFL